jgi:hypothetical protein
MTVRDDRGSIVSREAYSYEFDKFGNWTKMTTSLVVFENGELKREPVEITYRTVTYYFDDTVAKIVEEPKPVIAPAIPEPASLEVQVQKVLHPAFVSTRSEELTAEPPPVPKSVKSVAEKPAVDKTDNKTINTGPIQAAEAQLALGHTYLKEQKDREAIKAFKESIKLNPNVAETYYGLGFSNFRLGRFRDAADAFRKAINLSPRMAKAHYGLSLSYQELNNTSGVLEEYKILESLDKTLAKKLEQTFPQYNFSCRLVRGCP